MGVVWDHFSGGLAHGEQAAADGPEIQGLFPEEQYAQVDPAADRRGFRYLSEMAGGAGGVHFLHYRIFALQKQDNMTFPVQVKVMPLKELLDPQGKAVMSGLESLGLKNVSDVRIGKNISLQVEAGSADEARQIAEEAGKKLLANPVMEYFEIAVN